MHVAKAISSIFYTTYRLGQSWIGVAVGPWPYKILCAAWHKIHGHGQLEFVFGVCSKDFAV